MSIFTRNETATNSQQVLNEHFACVFGNRKGW
jgi:hypothetical protein